MGHSDLYIARRSSVHEDLRRTLSEPIEPADDDPQYRHDQAIRSIELGFYTLLELGPHMVDAHRLAGLAGDIREHALVAHEVQRYLRRVK
jgi:hypothetical protein